jgi:hypothetical protein
MLLLPLFNVIFRDIDDDISPNNSKFGDYVIASIPFNSKFKISQIQTSLLHTLAYIIWLVALSLATLTFL